MPVWILFVLVIVFVLAPLAHSLGNVLEARASRTSLEPGADDARRIDQLEERVAFLVDELHQLAEKQEFLTRLLEAEPTSASPAELEDDIG